ncbi:type IV secretion system protein VirB3 [Massilia sp. erpn]|uniref:type IV secretion system protein VirB3 n=1 Tax=Massilia sp. erpn TaxID=2738142 RepID=UPI002103EDFA|nr:VirB3 family type IV secretion system protein [Massilia sp. erpn]UTY59674.1 VirB3 family type IV secretion system protein [Massilia sp. erpn]
MAYEDVVFKGATRPAMMLGVPIVPLILVVGLHLLLAVWAMVLVNLFVSFVILAAGAMNVFFLRHVSSNDEQRLNQYLLRMKSTGGRRNKVYWGAHSASPCDYRRHV